MIARYLLWVVLSLALVTPAAAERRVALVIGNSAYAVSALTNPTNDAEDVARVLRTLGFEVDQLVNARFEAFTDAIDAFRTRARGADVALLYYAGHSLQFDGDNWLMPVDTNVGSAPKFRASNLSLQTVIRDLEGTAKSTLVFLDACRTENKLADRFYAAEKASGRDYGTPRGLAAVRAQTGNTLLVYATEPNKVAADGTGRNSPFTLAFLSHVATPGIEIETLMKRVSAAVEDATGGEQRPERLSKLRSEFYFVPAVARPPAAGGTVIDADARARIDYANAKVIGTIDGWDRFIAKYPAGDLTAAAKMERGRLSSAQLAPNTPHQIATLTPTSPDVPKARPLAQAFKDGYRANPILKLRADFTTVAFAPDGVGFVLGLDSSALWSWDGKSMQNIGEGSPVVAAAFSPDGKILVSSGIDEIVHFWDTKNRSKLKYSVDKHEGVATKFAFAPDGQSFVAGTKAKIIYHWDTKTGKQIGQISRGHESHITSIAFAPDGNSYISGSLDGTIRRWNAKSGQQIGQSVGGNDGLVLSIAFTPDGNNFMSAALDNIIHKWDTRSGQKAVQSSIGHQGPITGIAFARDGSVFISGSLDNTIRRWDAKTGRQVGEPSYGSQGGVFNVGISSDSKSFISVSGDKNIRRWDTATGALLQTIIPMGDAGWLVLGPDGMPTAIAGNEDELYSFELDGKTLKPSELRALGYDVPRAQPLALADK